MSPNPTTEFHLVGSPTPTPLTVLGRRRVRTLEGRLQGSLLAHPYFVAGIVFALVTAGEVSTLLVSGGVGIALHALALLGLITHAALIRRVNPALSRMLIALAPAPLIRIVSLTSPLAQFSYVQWFTILAVIIYAGIVTSIKILRPDLASIGLRLPAAKHIPLELAVIAMGFVFGWMEWHILKPGALVPDLRISNLIAPILVLYVATGLLEELLFRGLMQKYATESMGTVAGIVFATALFGVLHTGWNSWLDVLFVSAVGGIYACVVLRTKSIIGVSISHGITNAMLFLIMPFLQI